MTFRIASLLDDCGKLLSIQFGLMAGEVLPALDNNLRIDWINFYRQTSASCLLGSYKRGAGSYEGIVNVIAWR